MTFSREKLRALAFVCLASVAAAPIFGQEPAPGTAVAPTDRAEKAANSPDTQNKPTEPQLPFQIQLLETHIRFEANGDSRKEVHTIVKLNNILGARQFSRIGFDYNRSFQQVEIPLVRISHANGGTSELLPSAVTDAPNPAVEKYSAYQDVRVKSVRILGLQEGDTVEYRVITTTTKAPLAPDFWLEHTFDRSGQVLQEIYTLVLPNKVKPEINPDVASAAITEDQNGNTTYQWKISVPKEKGQGEEVPTREPDIKLTSFSAWKEVSSKLADLLHSGGTPISAEMTAKSAELTKAAPSCTDKLRSIYDFVSRKVITVDLPIGSMGFRTRSDAEILATGYATPEDKFKLIAALAHGFTPSPVAFLTDGSNSPEAHLPTPSLFNHLLIRAVCASTGAKNTTYWLDPGMEVAPFGVVASNFRGKEALATENSGAENSSSSVWELVPRDLPFSSTQKVSVNATLNPAGDLSAKVKYVLRGDNELLLRVAFHQTPQEKWKDVAGLLAISDGFRGQVTSVTVSDPKATKDPFVVDYEITQPKFVDWSKKPVRIPALLPQIGLPDPPAHNVSGTSKSKIELGTPLDVDTRLTLHVPLGTGTQAPAGTSVERDYATFSSKYVASSNTLTASRRVNFLAREIPGDRAADYNAFLRAVQNDQAQLFTLIPPQSSSAPTTKPPTGKP